MRTRSTIIAAFTVCVDSKIFPTSHSTRPVSIAAASGSPASSPQTATRAPCLLAPSQVIATSRRSAGEGPSSSAATEALPRSSWTTAPTRRRSPGGCACADRYFFGFSLTDYV